MSEKKVVSQLELLMIANHIIQEHDDYIDGMRADSVEEKDDVLVFKGKARSEKREARSEKREARSEKREARSEKREARSEKREARSEKILGGLTHSVNPFLLNSDN
ncbi:DUF2498 family protein [Vibrio brasiliensis]|uniref:DUF2498 family protein n=1 Tax=Vibrio brasiliensis TaxID=170652 RepID=UPI001EFDA372|nr:DUF2498 family protein [Vibrio brasiliensis]MCG9724379.1 DUF2498 family protein [Vibrio brasiliensis]